MKMSKFNIANYIIILLILSCANVTSISESNSEVKDCDSLHVYFDNECVAIATVSNKVDSFVIVNRCNYFTNVYMGLVVDKSNLQFVLKDSALVSDFCENIDKKSKISMTKMINFFVAIEVFSKNHVDTLYLNEACNYLEDSKGHNYLLNRKNKLLRGICTSSVH